jgi:hypothetical protein
MNRFYSNLKPFCVNCAHFIPHKNNYPYDPIPSDSVYGKCRKFFDVNLVTGIVKYKYAIDCRIDNDKCDVDAKEFMEKN